MARGNGQGMVLEDVWSCLRTIEREHTVATQVSMLPKTRRGVFGVRMRVFTVVDGKPHRCIVERFEEWPNVRVMTLEALLFQMATDVALRTDEAVRVIREQAQF